ncbi:MAG: hypothetical protein ACM3WS_03265 [Bacillota bacterium]
MPTVLSATPGWKGFAARHPDMQYSMIRKRTGWDNAPTERFFNDLKSERVPRTRYATRVEIG